MNEPKIDIEEIIEIINNSNYKTKEDIQNLINLYQKSKDDIEKKYPVLHFIIKNLTPKNITTFFDKEGKSIQGFRVPKKSKKNIEKMRKLYSLLLSKNDEFLSLNYADVATHALSIEIELTPEFLNEEDIKELETHKKIKKIINGIEIELILSGFRLTDEEIKKIISSYQEEVKNNYLLYKKKSDTYADILKLLEEIKKQKPASNKTIEISNADGNSEQSGFGKK